MIKGLVLERVYCEGWDPRSRTVVGPLAAATARERDDHGEPYAVALIVPETGLPHVLVEIAWRDRFARCWRFDEQARRQAMVEYRRLTDNQLFTLCRAHWEYQTPDQPEFADRIRHVERRFRPDGYIHERVENPDGSSSESYRNEGPVDDLMLLVPGFADSAMLAKFDGPIEVRERPDPEPGTPTTDPPWRPPRAYRPRGLEELFTAGSRIAVGDERDAMVDVRDGGILRMPSGRLVAADPAWLSLPPEPYTVTVAPGDYPVRLAVVRVAGDPSHERTAAAKLVISEEPVVSWELGLRPGQDPILLDDGQFYGFGVDAGMGCFVDADSAAALGEIARDSELMPDDFGRAAELVDPETGANLIAYSSGWGDGAYPVWIGRTAEGTVACFVADMCMVSDDSHTS